MQIDLKTRPPSRVLVDTSVLIVHLRGDAHGKRLMTWAGNAGPPYVSAVSILEIAQGMARSEEEATRTLLDSLEQVDVIGSLAWDAGILLRELRRDGMTIHLPDALIAVSARNLRVPVLTHNVRHYTPVPSLDVLDARTVSNTE